MIRLRLVPRLEVTNRVFLLKILAVKSARPALRRMMVPWMTATWLARDSPASLNRMRE